MPTPPSYWDNNSYTYTWRTIDTSSVRYKPYKLNKEPRKPRRTTTVIKLISVAFCDDCGAVLYACDEAVIWGLCDKCEPKVWKEESNPMSDIADSREYTAGNVVQEVELREFTVDEI